jgi:hypothetical protein
MSFTEEWADLLTWSCQISVPTDDDAYGNKQWAAPVVVEAHVDQTTLAEATPGEHDVEGTERQSGTIYFGTDAAVTPVPLTKVTFPYGLEVNLTMVIKHYDDDGAPHHYECAWSET